MAESVAQDRGKPPSAHTRRQLIGPAVGRVGRWLVFGVILAAVPILVSFIFLPKTSSATSLLSHGDFAVLASALGGAAIGELLGPDEPPKWLRNILISACILLFAAAIILLASIAGNAGRLSVQQKANYSWLLFIIAVIVGIASMGLTIRRLTHEQRDVDTLIVDEVSPEKTGGEA